MKIKTRPARKEDFTEEQLLQLSRLETLAYLCFSVGNQAREEIDSILLKKGMFSHDIKYFASKLTAAFDLYNYQLKQLYNHTEEQGKNLCEDYSVIRKALYRFANLEPEDE